MFAVFANCSWLCVGHCRQNQNAVSYKFDSFAWTKQVNFEFDFGTVTRLQ